MRPVSAQFAAAIVQSHRLATQVEVLESGVVAGDPLTSVASGTVTLDARAQSRGRLDITILDDGALGLIPAAATDPLAPYGNELRVSRGIRYPDNTTELVPLGVFRIDETEVSDSAGQLTVQIAGMDRSARIADARFEEPFQIPAGVNVATQILTLVQAAYPAVVSDFAPTPHVTGVMFIEEGADRWALCQQLATNAGMRLYFDGLGTLIFTADSQSGIAATIAEGNGGLLVSAGRRWTRQGAFNRVIVTGENTSVGVPVRAVATDTNPLSPTYYFGPFGPVPRFFQSQFIVTAAQAQDAANAMLARELGTTQSVNFGSIVLPHLEPGDVVRITRQRAGVDEDHIIDSLTIGLGADQAMSGATRATQVT